VKIINRTVLILSLVSLFADVASEMLYPVIPVYLKEIGFSVLLIGILEGVANFTAGLSKGYFGKLSDEKGLRLPFVKLGYFLSAASKPMMAAFIYPLWIFFARTIDRFGKGLRTGARDAMLSDESSPQTKGKVFGFHRTMDTFGAVLGPCLALLYLWQFPGNYKTLFFIAFIPGIASVFLSLMIRDKNAKPTGIKKKEGFFSFLKYWKRSPDSYRKVVKGLLVFALVNSSDVFLLLRAKDSGLNDTMVIAVYIFYNLIYAICSLPAGIIADKIGLKKILIIGLLLFSLVYFLIGFISSLAGFLMIFAIYGMYAAATEGISKALISNITDKKDTATAIGTYAGLQSICALLASTIAGLIWFNLGMMFTFLFSGIVVALIVLYFIFFVRIKIAN
jgi:MFS family permease